MNTHDRLPEYVCGMKAYVSISFSKRKEMKEELNSIIKLLSSHRINPFVFVDNFNFTSDQEKEMMNEAMNAIDDCDLLIAETSDKAIGIGVEVGYAKAKGKPVIYLRNEKAEHSTTASGISDFAVLYNGINDLEEKLQDVLTNLINGKV